MRTGKWQGQPGPGLRKGAPSYFCHCPFHRDVESLLQGHQPLPGRPGLRRSCRAPCPLVEALSSPSG